MGVSYAVYVLSLIIFLNKLSHRSCLRLCRVGCWNFSRLYWLEFPGDIGSKAYVFELFLDRHLTRGVIFANFQAEGTFCSAKVLFNIIEAGWARTSAKSFNNQFGKPSGPKALRELSFF